MVFIVLALNLILWFTFFRTYTCAAAHKSVEDELWDDRPSCMTATDQSVIDIALLINDLIDMEIDEYDHAKRIDLRQKVRKESENLVYLIMDINLLEPKKPRYRGQTPNIDHPVKG